MAKSKKSQQESKNIVAVEEALSKTEQFIERNQNIIISAVAIIVLIIAGYIGYTRFILEPREKEGLAEMFMAEKYFQGEEFELALEGDGEFPGFLDIISGYRMTKAANLARYYAGISLINLGEFKEGVDHLQRFRKRDQMLGAMAYGAIGDAYWELGDLQRAARYYRSAYRHQPNNLTTPAFLLKAGLLYEHKGEYAEALRLYERIQREFADSNEARDIEKFIARARHRM
ncbi:MAG: tetratricopeptide repeat protein [Bacteroidia bacterium]|nr:MAG: tetratricopeptide repeat protein [Bacteroidia bacterium]